MYVLPSFAFLLIFITSAAPAQESSLMKSGRDKAELRGPVKTVLEEQSFSYPDGHQQFTATTTKYASDGRILEQRTKNGDGSEWVMSHTYHSDGLLLRTVTGNTGSTDKSETAYLYDEARRLVAVKSGDKVQGRYQYDDAGRRSATENYDSKPLRPNTAYATHWEGTDLGFVPSSGGRVTTAYNEQGVATGSQFYDADGVLVGHIVRKFSADGRVTAEQQVADSPQLNLPGEVQSKLNPEQMKSVGTLIAGLQNCAISYSYDDQGRVTERHRSGGMFGDQVTVTTYNDHGDKASERVTTVMNSDRGPWSLTEAGAVIPAGKPNPPHPAQTSETQYTYQYDQYGNWTEQTTIGRSQPGEAFQPGTVIRRKLTYY